MSKGMYIDIMKFIVLYMLLCNFVVICHMVDYVNDSVKYQNDIYLDELKGLKVTIEENLGITVIKEYTLFKYEEIPKEEFTVSELVPLTDELQEFLYYMCRIYNLDYYLVVALIDTESYFQAEALSNGNYGLMQINEINHSWLENELLIGNDFLNPCNNLIAGCYMLSEISQKYTTYNEILMVYNIGEAGANRLFNMGLYETDYTNKIYEKYYYYGGVNYVN